MSEHHITVDSVPLPLTEIVTGRGFLTGKSGAGKSNSAGVLIERILDQGIPVCVIDSEGEHSALTEEYPVVHAGASPTCDAVVNATDATAVADMVCDQHIPVVLDTSEFIDSEEVDELVCGVVRRLFEREKRLQQPLLLVVEECHELIPQNGGGDVKDMLITVAKRGRKRGLGLCGLSQRPASVDKDFITQCDWHVWHRLTWPNDVAVVKEFLDGEHAGIVEDLDVGEALIWSDWEDRCQRVQWPRKRTPDLGAVPSIERSLDSTPASIDATVFEAFEAFEEGDKP